jgi:phospholipid-binding lipoprotein MlaA
MQAKRMKVSTKACVLSLIATCFMGCSTAQTQKDDPMEGWNRKVFAMNKRLDRYIIKPIALTYRFITPKFVRVGITNFFSNVDDITVIANDFLQFNGPQVAPDIGRFLINTTVGLVGFIDVASRMGLEKHDEDFGQTLGVWSFEYSPYFVLPLLGPSTLRDTAGRGVDVVLSPFLWVDIDDTILSSVKALEVTNARSNILDREGVIDMAAIDEYTFVRDAYLKNRRYKIYNGKPPHEEGEPADDFDKPLDEPTTNASDAAVSDVKVPDVKPAEEKPLEEKPIPEKSPD